MMAAKASARALGDGRADSGRRDVSSAIAPMVDALRASRPSRLERVYDVADTVVILPTYQEAASIEHVLRAVREAVPAATVLVVDDASPDGTAELAAKIADEIGGIEILCRPAKTGLGLAYRAGFAWAKERGASIVVEMDADGSHDAASLPALIAAVAYGADLAIGSRYVPGGSTPAWAWHRKMLSRWGNRYAAMALGLAVNDATSGFRALDVAMVDEIDLDKVRADGYGFQIELTYRVVRLGARVVEIPIEFRDRELGESKMSGRIVAEAFALVTAWGGRDLLLRRRRRRPQRRQRAERRAPS